jgi:hypothetical protein
LHGRSTGAAFVGETVVADAFSMMSYGKPFYDLAAAPLKNNRPVTTNWGAVAG